MEAVKHISPRAEQLIGEYQLGQTTAEYTENRLQTGLSSLILLPMGIILMLPPFYTIFHDFSSLSTGDWSERIKQAENVLNSLFLGSCFLFAGIFTAFSLVKTLMRGEKKLYLGEKGFVVARRQVEIATRWEGVQELRRLIRQSEKHTGFTEYIHSSSTYMITLAEGKHSSLYNAPGPIIETAVTTSLLPHAIENYRTGKTLDFGWLALDHQGIDLTPGAAPKSGPHAQRTSPTLANASQKLAGTSGPSGERLLPWDELELFWIDESRSTLVISKRSGHKHWAIVPLPQVINAALCQKLVEEILYGEPHKIV